MSIYKTNKTLFFNMSPSKKTQPNTCLLYLMKYFIDLIRYLKAQFIDIIHSTKNWRILDMNWLISYWTLHILNLPLLPKHQHNLCQNINLIPKSKPCFINLIKYPKNHKNNLISWEKNNMNNSRSLELNWFVWNQRYWDSQKILKW